jgi:uncharacterized membrane protein YvlD (DUF360 family)
MVRLLIGFGIQLLANALGLVAAAILLEKVHVSGAAFVIAVVLFTVVYAIAQPFLAQMAISKIPALRGGVALVATLVGLVVTSWLSDGLSISGFATWILATVIVWAVALLGALLLPVVLVKKAVRERRA